MALGERIDFLNFIPASNGTWQGGIYMGFPFTALSPLLLTLTVVRLVQECMKVVRRRESIPGWALALENAV
jgi:hypothetical protein